MKKQQYETGTGDLFGFEDIEDEGRLEFAKAFEEYSHMEYLPKENTIIKGTYYGHNESYAIVTTDFKSAALINMNSHEMNVINGLNDGDDVEVLVQKIIDNNKETIIYGSIAEVSAFHSFQRMNTIIEDAHKNKTTLKGTPINYSIFGYDVIINEEGDETTIHMPHLLTDVNKLPNPDSIIGQEIEFGIIKDDKGNYVASRKKHLLTLAKKQIKTMVLGEVYTGFVTGTKPYALFVQIGNLTGMVHISNLGEQATELLKSGQIVPGTQIEVYLRDIINDQLVLSQMSGESLWNNIKCGDKFEGTIYSIKDFNSGDYGILVELDYETKGMIHSSTITKDKSTYKVGEDIKVEIKNIFKPKRQITLIEI